MDRVELHIESSYSYKDMGSDITPQDILEKINKDKETGFCVVDYANCAAIPILEKLKKQLGLDKLKIGYGIALKLKEGNTEVLSVILAKNDSGLKALYTLVTKLNKKKQDFLDFYEINPFRKDLILGISHLNLDKDYENIIKYYDYIEVTFMMDKEMVIKINDYALKNNLLLIATARPHDKKLINKDEMLQAFDYLDNKEEIVINNPLKIMNKIEHYNISFKTHLVTRNNYSLKEEVYEKAGYVYFYGINKQVKERIDYELDIFQKYNLEGTILLLEELIKKADRMGYKATIGGYLANTVTAYILGLIDIDITNLKNRRDLENDIKHYGLDFQINIPYIALKQIKDYLLRITKQQVLYRRNAYLFSDNKLKQIGLTPETYYIVPEKEDMSNFTPILCYEKEQEIISTGVFDPDYMDKLFAKIYFRCSFHNDIITELERETNMFINCIPFNELKVIKACFKEKERNQEKDYLSARHYFLHNNYLPELTITSNDNTINSLENFIDLKNKEQKDWISKVMEYYYLNYYKVHYPEKFYPVYLQELSKHFNLKNMIDEEFLKEIKRDRENKTIDKKIKEEKEASKSIIMEIVKRMLELNIDIKY